jgi:hypothetical protein
LRHGIDVAASLARRHGAALRESTGQMHPPALTVLQDHGLGVLSSRRGWNLMEAFTMWEQYVEKARANLADVGDRGIEVRFEDLLERPDELIETLAEFCGVPAPEQVEKSLEQLDSGRALAYRQEPALVRFAETVRDALGRHGYTP